MMGTTVTKTKEMAVGLIKNVDVVRELVKQQVMEQVNTVKEKMVFLRDYQKTSGEKINPFRGLDRDSINKVIGVIIGQLGRLQAVLTPIVGPWLPSTVDKLTAAMAPFIPTGAAKPDAAANAHSTPTTPAPASAPAPAAAKPEVRPRPTAAAENGGLGEAKRAHKSTVNIS